MSSLENKFEILEESGQDTQYYWITFKSVKWMQLGDLLSDFTLAKLWDKKSIIFYFALLNIKLRFKKYKDRQPYLDVVIYKPNQLNRYVTRKIRKLLKWS